MKKTHRVQLKTLQPGFLWVSYTPGEVDPGSLVMSRSTWEEAKAKGFYGGIILPRGVELTSLSDQDLEKVRLKRMS